MVNIACGTGGNGDVPPMTAKGQTDKDMDRDRDKEAFA